MRLHRLKLLNFRQHADSEIEFGDGITAIIGPNGSGKSTLLEAMAWAFYGTPAARGTRDSLRWNRAPARSTVRVEVEFTLGAHEYRVVRTLYGAELYQDRAPEAVANSQQEVTSWVQRLLGMTREEFFNTYFTGQKELTVMAAMGPTERAKFLSRVLGYERLRLAQDRVREVRSTLRGELQGLTQTMGDPEALEREREAAYAQAREVEAALAAAIETRDQTQRGLAEAEPAWRELERRRETALQLDGERRLADQKVEDARHAFDRLDRELAEALAAQTQLQELAPALEEIEPLRTELERLERESRAAARRQQLAGELAETDRQLTRLSERLAGAAAREAAITEAAAALEASRTVLQQAQEAEEHARTAWVRDRQDAETKHLALRDQYRELQAHRDEIERAGPDGICPTCARPLGDEYETVVATLARQLEEIELNGRFFRQRVEQLAPEPAEVVDTRRAVERARADVERLAEGLATARVRVDEDRDVAAERERTVARRSELVETIAGLPETYDAERHDAVRDRLRALEPVAAQAASLRAKAERAERLVKEAEAAERDLSEREGRARELRDAIATLGFDEAAHRAARVRYDTAVAAVRDAELAVAGREGDRKAAERAVAGIERQLEERRARAARAGEVQGEITLHDELDTSFQDLRAELNAQLRPELSDLASAFLSELTDGRYHEVELDEQYRLLILEEGEPRPVISGGEEDVANLVLRLAISQMVAERAGQPLSLLVLDEIFGSLDESRRQHVVGLLRHLSDRFPQVVLITHIESVRDSVDRVLRVALDPGRGMAVVTEDRGGGDEDVAA